MTDATCVTDVVEFVHGSKIYRKRKRDDIRFEISCNSEAEVVMRENPTYSTRPNHDRYNADSGVIYTSRYVTGMIARNEIPLFAQDLIARHILTLHTHTVFVRGMCRHRYDQTNVVCSLLFMLRQALFVSSMSRQVSASIHTNTSHLLLCINDITLDRRDLLEMCEVATNGMIWRISFVDVYLDVHDDYKEALTLSNICRKKHVDVTYEHKMFSNLQVDDCVALGPSDIKIDLMEIVRQFRFRHDVNSLEITATYFRYARTSFLIDDLPVLHIALQRCKHLTFNVNTTTSMLLTFLDSFFRINRYLVETVKIHNVQVVDEEINMFNYHPDTVVSQLRLLEQQKNVTLIRQGRTHVLEFTRYIQCLVLKQFDMGYTKAFHELDERFRFGIRGHLRGHANVLDSFSFTRDCKHVQLLHDMLNNSLYTGDLPMDVTSDLFTALYWETKLKQTLLRLRVRLFPKRFLMGISEDVCVMICDLASIIIYDYWSETGRADYKIRKDGGRTHQRVYEGDRHDWRLWSSALNSISAELPKHLADNAIKTVLPRRFDVMLQKQKDKEEAETRYLNDQVSQEPENVASARFSFDHPNLEDYNNHYPTGLDPDE